MTDNDRLKAWQDNGSTPNIVSPDYLNDDSAAMSLLDTLVEKGFEYEMGYQNGDSYPHWIRIGNLYIYTSRTTRREAITSACLELIKKTDHLRNWCEITGISP